MTFQPGQSGNPKGTRKEKLCYEALMLELKACQDSDPRSLRGIMRNLITLAAGGDLQAIKELMNRIDGMPAQEQFVEVNETKTVIRSPAPESTTDAWMNRVTKSSGNLSKAHKPN